MRNTTDKYTATLAGGLLCAALVAFTPAPAGAETQYGITVDSNELIFMMALHARGVDVELGRAGPVNYEVASGWYRRAAVLGFPLAQNDLARMYELGLGVPRDHVLAHAWYLLAAASGDPIARLNRDRLAERMSGEQRAAAQIEARQLSMHLP